MILRTLAFVWSHRWLRTRREELEFILKERDYQAMLGADLDGNHAIVLSVNDEDVLIIEQKGSSLWVKQLLFDIRGMDDPTLDTERLHLELICFLSAASKSGFIVPLMGEVGEIRLAYTKPISWFVLASPNRLMQTLIDINKDVQDKLIPSIQQYFEYVKDQKAIEAEDAEDDDED